MNNQHVIVLFQDCLFAMRIRHWFKNVVLLLAPIGAAVHPTKDNFKVLIFGFVAFCFISSAGYILNDWVDKENDRFHDKKKLRPFAANRLTAYHAFSLVILLVICSLMISSSLPNFFKIWLLVYTFSTTLYSLVFKKIPVLELVIVAFGFLVRCLAGAALFEVEVSQWFLIVTGFGSLFLVSTKRTAEFKKGINAKTRKVLSNYTETFLNAIMSISISTTIIAYAMWAFEVFDKNILGKLSVIPVLLGILRYLWHFEIDDGETPEKAIFSDKLIATCGVISGIMLILAIYL